MHQLPLISPEEIAPLAPQPGIQPLRATSPAPDSPTQPKPKSKGKRRAALPIIDAVRAAELASLNPLAYDRVIITFSGGKDSLACVLHLIELGVPRERIELWHHLVDGREGSTLMDWPCTESYCRAVAKALGLPIYFSWKVGGLEREMLRNNTPTAPTRFETPEGRVVEIGGNGPLGTRRKFPMISNDLTRRWCSGTLKIDVAAAAIRNQARFNRRATLFVTGERAEESQKRADYEQACGYRADTWMGRDARKVDQWRPVHPWAEAQVWEIIERWKINPHPAYRIGFGRVSCALCIFGSCNQWATANEVLPESVGAASGYELQFRYTMKNKETIPELVARGRAYPALSSADRAALIAEARCVEWGDRYPVFVDEWVLPVGAFGEKTGPT